MKKCFACLLCLTMLLGIMPVSLAENTEPITLEFWRPINQASEENWYKAKVAEFNELYEGKIFIDDSALTRGDSWAYEDKIAAAAATDSLPDIIFVDGPNLANYAYSGLLAPIDEYYTEEELKDFVPSSLQQGSYNGSMYAVSLGEGIINLYYNKTMFAEAGIEVPQTVEDAWTWDEFYEICKTLTTDDVYGTNMLVEKSGEWLIVGLQNFFVSNGASFISDDMTTAEGYINSEAAIEAGQYIQKLADEGLMNIDPMSTEFEEGKCATKIAGAWFIPTLDAAKEATGLDWGITYLPYAKENKGSCTGGWQIGITPTCKDADAAMEFIKWLTSTENCASFFYDGPRYLPIRYSSYELIPDFEEAPYSVLKETLTETGVARPITPNYPVLTSKFSEAMYDIMLGADVKESLDGIAQAYDAEWQQTYAK
ncbi:ABC transporter substrate-binding protein [Ruthenibacterium lactatiformans]|uniref:ABC transporter substrate-binding protein n=1 Tax=Ruthenibacterium lactatiformans TaxID=1550024 RepID=UPI003AB92211